MKIKFGVANTSRVVEIESDDTERVRVSVEEAFAKGDPVLWIRDSDGTLYGIPKRMLAFVEFESPGSRSGIGFASES